MAELPAHEDDAAGDAVLAKWEHQPLLNPVQRLLYSTKFVFGTILIVIVALAGATPQELIDLGMFVYGFVAGGNILEGVAEKLANGR